MQILATLETEWGELVCVTIRWIVAPGKILKKKIGSILEEYMVLWLNMVLNMVLWLEPIGETKPSIFTNDKDYYKSKDK